ncbi:MAG TPA: rhomboid family intramembrane serine protease [Beijerinckiaceae bacterium]|jgi:membrane associated rhomboid family serine protease
MSDRYRGDERREPIVNLPGVIVGLILLFAAIHAARVFLLGDEGDAALLRLFAFTPGQFTFAFDPDRVAGELTRLAREGLRDRLVVGQYFLGDGFQPWTVLSYAFLHADWTHLAVNSLWLAAFGAPVATRFGAGRFLALLAVTAVAGAALHYAVHPVDLTPVIGASAAVSGVMAAAVRFVFRAGAPLGPALPYPRPPDESVRLPAFGVVEALRNRRVIQFSLIWFAVNLVIGLLAVPLGIAESGIAWEAHAGGFIAGFFLFPLFDPIRSAPGAPPEDAWRDA